MRKAQEMTLQELAFACNDIDYAQINNMELEKVNFSISYLKLIADMLNVSVTDLLALKINCRSL
jgi:transcriptional regulator with XRE-family HTH domain